LPLIGGLLAWPRFGTRNDLAGEHFFKIAGALLSHNFYKYQNFRPKKETYLQDFSSLVGDCFAQNARISLKCSIYLYRFPKLETLLYGQKCMPWKTESGIPRRSISRKDVYQAILFAFQS
jgi:hypothetical protein